MASIRQIFILYVFVALLCHIGESQEVSKREVGELFHIFIEKLLHSLDSQYHRFGQGPHYVVSPPYSNSDVLKKSTDNLHKPFDKSDSWSSDESSASDYFDSISLEDEHSEEHDFHHLTNELYHVHKDDRWDKDLRKSDFSKQPKDSSFKHVPKDSKRQYVSKNSLPIGNIPYGNIPLSDRNGGRPGGFNKLRTPPNIFGAKPIPNYIPIGAPNYNGYYPNIYPGQQMYYLIRLSNGQPILVPESELLALKRRPGYGPIFPPNYNQVFAPDRYLYPLQYNDYILQSIYGQRFLPGQKLPRPRRGGLFPGRDQPYFHIDYSKILKDIFKDLAGRKNHEGVPFIDYFKDFDTSPPFDYRFSHAIKDEGKITFPEKKIKKVQAENIINESENEK